MYSSSEMERMMKRQDVLLRAMARKITWLEAAEIIGVTDRTMRRWRERLEERLLRAGGRPERKDHFSASATKDVRRGPAAVPREVLRLQHSALSRKAANEHGIEVSYTWVQQALQGAGLVKRRQPSRTTSATPGETGASELWIRPADAIRTSDERPWGCR